MKTLPICRGCSKELVWKQPYKKGDRPLEKDGSKHDCKKWFESDNTRFAKNNKNDEYKGYRKLYEYERCPYCKGSNYGYCRKETKDLEIHVNAYHPNKEILYDDDFKMSGENMLKKDMLSAEEKSGALKTISDSWESDFQSF